MKSAVTVNAKRDQVRFRVISESATKFQVMNLEVRHRSAVLAPPVITLQHLSTEFLVFARGEADTRSLRSRRLHEAIS
jgi:hypothetical protein